MATGFPPTSVPDYDLLHYINRGTFGSVWLGQHRLLKGEYRAIKLVLANGKFGQAELEGVRTYMQIARDHPHLVPIEHLGDHNGFYYFVMPLADDLKGRAVLRTPDQYEPLTLSSYCELHRPLPLDKVLTVARHILSALDYLHTKGLVHCDVKPANVLSVDGFWRLTDMSILLRRNLLNGQRGTTWFMPPEGNWDRTGDLFALGKALFLLATNSDPSRFGDFVSGQLTIPGDDSRRADFQQIIQTACASNTAQRFQTAGQMYAAIHRLTRPTLFELRIDEDFSTLTPALREEVVTLIRQRCNSEVRVESIRPGSIIFTLKLLPDDGERLLAAVRAGRLGRFRVLDGGFVTTEPAPARVAGPLSEINRSEEIAGDQVLARLKGAGPLPEINRSEETLPVAASGVFSAGKSSRLSEQIRQEVPGYEILEELGRGGMGVVYKARHLALKRLVALKFIHPQHIDPIAEHQLVQRFQHEAQVLARLSHPNIVQVFDFARESGGDMVLVTEYVEGTDLQRLVQETGPLPVARTAELGRQIAAALACAHASCILHRDLKPGNVLLKDNGVVKVIDFGLARTVSLSHPGTAASGLTGTGNFLGTPAYCAPEQLEDAHRVAFSADVYSLGCTLFYLLTARPPFPADLAARHRSDRSEVQQAVSLTEFRPDVPREFAAIVQRLMAWDPDERLSAAELLQILEPWANQGEAPQAGADIPLLLEPERSALRQSDTSDRIAAALQAGNSEIHRLLARMPQKPQPKPGELFTNSLGMQFAWIPPGTFLMGSPPNEEARQNNETRHRVTLTKGFFLGVHLVTQEQWERVMGSHPSHFTGPANLPVEQVSWEDCQEFCRKLRETDGKPYRLPTESEWEYACRAGTTTPFFFGATISVEQANYDSDYTYDANGNPGMCREKTTPVGSFPANAWGLTDMHGNLWEWCQDWYGGYSSEDLKDPEGPNNGDARVLRGGSWNDSPQNCRAAFRGGDAPAVRICFYGCRVVFRLD